MTRSEQDDPLGPREPRFLLEVQQRALGALLLALSLAAPLVTLGLLQREGFSTLMGVGITLTVFVWFAALTFRLGHVRLAAHILVFAILATSILGVIAHGTVRSAAVLVMFAGVVGAGSFLPRSTMVVTAVLSLLALAVLNWLEFQGLLHQPDLRTGWALWITQSAVLLSVLVSVFHNRYRTREAFISQEAALERAALVEVELRASEGRFMGVFRNNPAATLVQRMDTREVLDANEAFARMFGYPRDVLVGQPLPLMWARSVDQLIFRQALSATGRVHGMRSQGLRRDGGSFEMLVYSEFMTEGPEQLVISMVLDVSTEEASRRELKQSEERFSKAFHFSPIGMTITRLSDGRFMEVNPANERVLGYTQADFQNRTALEAGVWVNDKDRNDYVNTLRRDGRHLGYETRMRNKQGEIVPVRVWSEIIEIDGESCALAFTLNIRAEKAREAILLNVAKGVSGETGQAFFHSLVDHLARAIGADGVLVGEIVGEQQLDTLALHGFGQSQPRARYSLDNTACGETLFQTGLFICSDGASERFNLLPPFRDAGVRALAGMALRDPDGSAIGLLTAAWRSPLDMDSNTRALIAIFASRCSAELVRLRRDREIEKLHETLEQRVEQRTAQLEYLNRELDTFAYTVSHDLKSPLRSIDGFTHLLREQMEARLQPDDRELFGRVEQSVQRMNSLINDLLALARVSQGTLQRMNTNLGELAQDVLRQERHRDPTRTVVVDIGPGLVADCDARMAHIVLENLLGNAWKYTRQQPAARIEFGQAIDQAGPAPVFFIRDNGAGFDMARADRLFKPFTRLHSSREFEGSGIGLATVRRILERHGGHIRAEAAVGQGACFWFSFGTPTVD